MKPIQPPRLATRLLRSFVSEERIDELEGDLYEIFQEKASEKNSRLVGWMYWWMVIRSFRSYALKNSKLKTINSMSNFFILLQHNLKLTLRQLWKQKVTTTINILGLAIGLAGFIAIYSLIIYENSFNHHIPNNDRIYRLYTEFSGAFSGYNRGVAAPTPGYLKENKPDDIVAITGFHTKTFHALPSTEKTKEPISNVKAIIADTSYFKVFEQYDWLAGSPELALAEPYQVVLTLDQAIKYFGEQQPTDLIGKEIAYNDSLHVYISGIVQQREGNSDFIFTDFISFATIPGSWLADQIDLQQWGSTNSSSQLWIRTIQPIPDIQNPILLSGINQHLLEMEEDPDWVRKLIISGLPDFHFDDLQIFDNRERSAANKEVLTVLAIASIALLFMAMFNFVNLETAQASGRSKEVGVRKVLGSNRKSLIGKFILESLLISTFAMILALPMAQYGMILFKEFLPGDIAINFWKADILLTVVGVVLAVGILTGLYPALRLSSISTERALKSNSRLSFAEKGAPTVRKVLISFQFLFAQVLIIGALTIFFQVSYLLNKDLGFVSENILTINTPYYESESKRDVFIQEISQLPEIQEWVQQMDPPTSNSYSSSFLTYRDGDQEIVEAAYRKSGDTSYLAFYGIDLLAGRNLTPTNHSKEIIINDTYRKKLGFEAPVDALDAQIEAGDDVTYLVVGVMEDFHTMSLRQEIKPTYFMYADNQNGIAFKVAYSSIQTVVEKVSDRYREIYPREVADIKFLDTDLKNLYESEQRMSKLSVFVTVLAIVISCLGLFGLVSLAVVQRTKEVGIRKVLGAGLWSIGRVISMEFVWLLGIAFAITVPLSYYLTHEWLDRYVYRVELGWWLYAIGGLISLLIAILAMSTKVYQAASANPVESLRYE